MLIILNLLLAAVPQWELNTSLTYVYDVYPDGPDSVWCASSGGVFQYGAESGIGTVYSCPEDLPIPDCRAVLLDPEGRIWVATEGKGLVMNDDGIWTAYSSFEGIPGQGWVNAIELAGGAIWIGCDGDGGLASGGAEGFVPVDPDLTGGGYNAENVYSLASRNDTLWLCTDRGIYTLTDLSNPFNPDSWIYWEDTRELQLDRIRAGESSIYVCGGSGALELSPGDQAFKFIIDYSAADSTIVDVLETSQGLLAAGRGTVMRREGIKWRTFGTGLPSDRWPTVLFEMGGFVYSGFNYGELNNYQTGLGFYRLENGVWVHFPIPGMQCKRTHQIASTADGRIYAGSYARGVQAFYPGFGWRNYVEEDGMPNTSQTFSVALDPVDGLWASSYHYGLSWIRDNENPDSQGDTILTFVKDSLVWHAPWATIIEADLPNNQPVMISAQENGLWAAFHQLDPEGQPDEPSGLLGFSGNPLTGMNWAPRLGGGGIASINVREVYPVSPDSLWISFESSAGCQLLVHSGNPADASGDSWYPGNGEAYSTADGLPSGEVYSFLNVPGTGLLAGTSEGLALWNGSGFSQFQSITGPVRSMSLDSRGRIWCLGESGIYRIADGEVSMFDEFNSDYVPSSINQWVYSATDLAGGGVFFSSIEGLWLVTQDSGDNPASSEVSFYPQPFIPGEDQLRLYVPDNDMPVSVEFFAVDGSHAGTVGAESVSNWIWNGSFAGETVAGGVYMALVSVGNTVYQARISVVR
jgi:hypothetical protein